MMRWLILLPPFVWLALLVAAPIGILAAIALAEAGPGVPPFLPPFAWGTAGLAWQGSLENFRSLVADGYYLGALLRSLGVAGVTAGLCLLLAYPMALGIAGARPAWRMPLLLLVLLPFWTGFLPRIGAWIGLLRDGGWVNGLLGALGFGPLRLLYTDTALWLGMVHAYLPFAVLPLALALLKRDLALEEAAADLGAGRFTVFRSITLPLSLPAAAAGFLLVCIPAAGEFVIPELLGPPEALLVGRALWGEFFQNRDWPLAAALAIALLAVLVLPIRLFQRLGVPRPGSR
jgi:putrescine transport system permease protein